MTGRNYTFKRNTEIVDEDSFLKEPDAPHLNAVISDGKVVLEWKPAATGGEVSGYHIYRKDAGEYILGCRMVQDAPWLSEYKQLWGNYRYLTINDADAGSFVDGGFDQYYQNDRFKGELYSLDWGNDNCPHEYWITAFNSTGESKPSKIFTFEYGGENENGTPIPPVSDDEIAAPGRPSITKLWVEWEDESQSYSPEWDEKNRTINNPDWDDIVDGYVHVAWKDSEAGGKIYSWKLDFDGVPAEYEGGNTETVSYSEVAHNPAIRDGDKKYNKAGLYAKPEDYGRNIKTTVTACNSQGETVSDTSELTVYSLPLSRAFPDNGSAKIEWTDLHNDNVTKVNSWKILRKSEYGAWEELKTLTAGGLSYAATDSNGVNSYMYRDNTVKNGWTYTYKVVAVCQDGIDRPGVDLVVTTDAYAITEKPGTPTNLRASVKDGGILFSWDAPVSGGAPRSYTIEREYDFDNNGEKEEVWSIEETVDAPSTSCMIYPYEPGTYRYRVYAFNYIKKSTVLSDYSNEVSVTITQEQLENLASEKPATPIVTATAKAGRITLNWTYDPKSGSVPTYYQILRSDPDNPNTSSTVNISGEGTSFTFVDDTVTSGVEYQYCVEARNSKTTSSAYVFVKAPGTSKDEETAGNVSNRIAALKEPDEITSEDSADVYSVKNLYDGLTKSQKSLIPDERKSKLDKCVSRIEYIDLYGKYSEAAIPVQNLIEGLPEAENVTLEDEEQVKAARDAYDALTPWEAKKIVDTTKLSSAEKTIADIRYNIKLHGNVSFTGRWVIGEDERPVIDVSMYGEPLGEDYYKIGFVKKGTSTVQSVLHSSGNYKIVITGQSPYYGRIVSTDYLVVDSIYDNETTTDIPDPDDDPAVYPGTDTPGTGDGTTTGTTPGTTIIPGQQKTGYGEDGTAVGKGASAEVAEKAITSSTSDEGPKGSTFAPLLFGSTKQTKNSVKCSWKKISGAKTYVIYGNLAGKKNKPVRLITSSGSSFTVKKINDKKLKKGTCYKFILVALDGNNKVVSTSKMIYVTTAGGKNGNYKKITTKAKKDKVTLKAGKTFKLDAKQVASSKKLKVKKNRKIVYETGNAKVASVSAKGVIKAVGKGSCYIYVYAQNGVYKRIKVTVK